MPLRMNASSVQGQLRIASTTAMHILYESSMNDFILFKRHFCAIQ